MDLSKRSFLKTAMGLSAYSVMQPLTTSMANLSDSPPEFKKYKKIAIEEAFATPELFTEWQKLLSSGVKGEPGFEKLYKPFLSSSAAENIREQLLDVGVGRIKDMDVHGIDVQILSITAPGIQVFGPKQAVTMAKKSNDQLAEFISAYPERYAGLAAVAPQSPQQAADELVRGVQELGLKGVIINSHTQGEYLDDPKYRVLFEAAQELDVPIYLHPRTPSPAMIDPFLAYGLEGAGWGFAVETSLHAMRLILSGLFDDLPNLKIILGHLGEGIPFWLSRIDGRFGNSTWTEMMKTQGQQKPLQKKPSQYFLDNFLVATSGVNWPPALTFARSVLGAERILFAIDYPYESTAKAVEGMEQTSFTEEDYRQIYYANAKKVFKI